MADEQETCGVCGSPRFGLIHASDGCIMSLRAQLTAAESRAAEAEASFSRSYNDVRDEMVRLSRESVADRRARDAATARAEAAEAEVGRLRGLYHDESITLRTRLAAVERERDEARATALREAMGVGDAMATEFSQAMHGVALVIREYRNRIAALLPSREGERRCANCNGTGIRTWVAEDGTPGEADCPRCAANPGPCGECLHSSTHEGPRIPLVYGSSATIVCDACGAWRTCYGLGRWRPAPELKAECFDSDEDGDPHPWFVDQWEAYERRRANPDPRGEGREKGGA